MSLYDRLVPAEALRWGPVTQRFRGEPFYNVPDDFTPAMTAVARTMHADVWTTPKPDYGDEWHRRFPWWMCCAAARLLADAGLLEDR